MIISFLGRSIVHNREKLYDKLSTLVDFGSFVLAFSFIGIAALSFGLAFTFAIQVAWLRHRSFIFIYQESAFVAIYFGGSEEGVKRGEKRDARNETRSKSQDGTQFKI